MSEHDQLLRLADALVEDILSASDEEIVQEFQEDHGDPEVCAAEMRQMIQDIVAKQHAR